MRISFHGAAQVVTGSKHLLHLDNGINILLDCGLFQGRKKDVNFQNRHWGFDPLSIHYLILSHAHIDHCGLIPKLVRDGFNGPIYCTPATLDLCKVMLPDSAHIQESDARFENKHRKPGKPLKEPMYTVEDAEKSLSLFQTIEFNEQFTIPNAGVQFSFIENGHLLGSGSVNLTITEGSRKIRVCFTGDIGRVKPNMLRTPQPFPQADYILCESTYGDRLHDDQDYSAIDVAKIIHETCIEKKGKVLVPAFSIGRTQEILYALDVLYSIDPTLKIPVYVDSPLSTKGTTIHRKYLPLFNESMQEYFQKDPTPFDFPFLHFIENAEQSKTLNTSPEPCIIISASGMMDAGRIRHHIFNHIENPNNTLLVVGYCEPSTLGGKIIGGAKEVKLFGEVKKVNARVEYIRSFSGHGDYQEMIHYLSCQNISQVAKVFLVHGEYPVQAEFKSKLLRAGFKSVDIPEAGQLVEL